MLFIQKIVISITTSVHKMIRHTIKILQQMLQVIERMFDHSAKTKRYGVKAYRIHQLVSVIWPFSQFGPSPSTEKKVRSSLFSCYFEITQKNYFDFLQGIDLYFPF